MSQKYRKLEFYLNMRFLVETSLEEGYLRDQLEVVSTKKCGGVRVEERVKDLGKGEWVLEVVKKVKGLNSFYVREDGFHQPYLFDIEEQFKLEIPGVVEQRRYFSLHEENPVNLGGEEVPHTPPEELLADA